MANLYSSENEVFVAFSFYAALLIVKMTLMSFLTARQRFRKGVFANYEDAASKDAKVKFDDPDVERVRRAHLNDLENIVPFLILALIYIGTNPNPTTAVLLIRIFTAARFIHTFVYTIVIVAQPARALAFFAGVAVTVYMAISVMSTYVAQVCVFYSFFSSLF